MKTDLGSYFGQSPNPACLFFVLLFSLSFCKLLFGHYVLDSCHSNQVSGLKNSNDKNLLGGPKAHLVDIYVILCYLSGFPFLTLLQLTLSPTTTTTIFFLKCIFQCINIFVIIPYSYHGLTGLFPFPFYFQPNILFYLLFSYDYFPINFFLFAKVG